HKLAGLKPAEAERVLGLLSKSGEESTIGGTPVVSQARDQCAVRVCYRMATVDLERARRLAGQIKEPCYQAHAYGVMAQALGKAKPAQALELLDKAFAVLRAHVDAGNDRFNGMFGASTVAGSLLPAAEEINPQLVPEFLWRAVALRNQRPAEGNEAA